MRWQASQARLHRCAGLGGWPSPGNGASPRSAFSAASASASSRDRERSRPSRPRGETGPGCQHAHAQGTFIRHTAMMLSASMGQTWMGEGTVPAPRPHQRSDPPSPLRPAPRLPQWRLRQSPRQPRHRPPRPRQHRRGHRVSEMTVCGDPPPRGVPRPRKRMLRHEPQGDFVSRAQCRRSPPDSLRSRPGQAEPVQLNAFSE